MTHVSDYVFPFPFFSEINVRKGMKRVLFWRKIDIFSKLAFVDGQNKAINYINSLFRAQFYMKPTNKISQHRFKSAVKF